MLKGSYADGKLDLLVGTIDGNVHLLKNIAKEGKPVFDAAEVLKLEHGRERVADAAPIAADWDADGLLDLLVGDVTLNYFECLAVVDSAHGRPVTVSRRFVVAKQPGYAK